MAKGLIPWDDSGKPTLALWNDATGQIIPLHAKSTVVGADGNTYAVLDASVNGLLASSPMVIAGLWDGGTQLQPAQKQNGDGIGNMPAVGPNLFDGTQLNRQRGNQDNITLINASNVSSTQTSADQTNYNARGIIVILNVTTIGTGSLITTINAKGPVSGIYKPLLTSLAVTTATSAIYIVYPGDVAAANLVSQHPVPRTWNVVVTGATGTTFTVEVSYIL